MKARTSPFASMPEGLRTFMGYRLSEAAGLTLIGISFFVLLSLLSWHSGDPSINTATGNPPQNWMGLGGAFIADVFWQALGLASFLFVLPLLAWGWRLIIHRGLSRLVLRVAAWLSAILFAAAFLGTLPLFRFWTLAKIGYGGSLGDFLADQGAALLSFTGNDVAYALTAAITAPAAFFLIFFAMDARPSDAAALVRKLLRRGREQEHEEDYESEVNYQLRRRKRAQTGERTQTGFPGRAPVMPKSKPKRSARPRRPDLEPSRLRVLIWTVIDFFTDWQDRLLRRGDHAALSAAEIAEARDNGGRFSKLPAKRRGLALDDEDEDGELEDGEFEDEEFEDGEDEDDDEDEDLPAPRGKTPPVKNALRIDRTASRVVKPSKRAAKEAQPTLNLGERNDYQLPPLNLLAKPKTQNAGAQLTDEALAQNARLLESVLDDFGIRGKIVQVRPGPVVTLYELEPAPGIKSSRIIALADDIARSMSAVSARVAVVQGRNAIGIELPNAKREMVFLRELLETADYENSASKLALALGKNIGGDPIISDLARMPHLLIAGTTGSGKSVGINTMILSLLYRLSPDQCKLIMIDPKMLELSVYDGIPHLLAPVVTEPKKAVVALKWVVKEMEDRYRKMSKVGVRNMDGYNTRVKEAAEKGEVLIRTVQTGFDRETGKAIYEEEEMDLEPLPFIVVIVDEMADLMMVAGKEIEAAVQRLAQMARAAGIHIVTATQRPSVDVITGTIKANFPTRISFQVTSKIDSRTILGEQGAEQLLGQGDMLYMAGGGRIRRVHGPFVSDEEVEKVVTFLKRQGVPEYLEAITAEPDSDDQDNLSFDSDGPTDDLYDKAVAIVARDKRASTSYIQRRLQIGYNRAARLIELMEEQGVISAPNHQGKREVLIDER